MKGVILCGGKSSRMGTDKGLLPHGTTSWAKTAVAKIAALQLPVIVSINQQQYPIYKSVFGDRLLMEDNPNLSIGGPLKGIVSVHLQKPEDDLLVVACDMPALQLEVLQHLLTASTAKKEEAFVFKNGEMVEPLCAIYTAKGLHKILQLYQQGELKRFSMRYVIGCLHTCFLPVPPQWEKCFTNYNAPEDLKDLPS